jgi:hypothetical protein
MNKDSVAIKSQLLKMYAKLAQKAILMLFIFEQFDAVVFLTQIKCFFRIRALQRLRELCSNILHRSLTIFAS